MTPPAVVLPLAVGLAAVHVVAGKLRFLRVVPRSRVLSAAGGISVAYVFVHLLPEIAHRQERDVGEAELANSVLAASYEHLLFLAALLGFTLFYGLEQLVRQSCRETSAGMICGRESDAGPGVFWTHIGTFAAYNALIGYLLVQGERTTVDGLVLFATAMALHFVVNDYGLREHHQRAYQYVGRWVLAVAVFVGVGVGYVTVVPRLFLSVLLAVLAGGIVLNVIKEELPEQRESRFWAFGTGLIGYTALLLVV